MLCQNGVFTVCLQFGCSDVVWLLRSQGVTLWWSSKSHQLYITLDVLSFLFKAVEGAGGQAHLMEVRTELFPHLTPHTSPPVTLHLFYVADCLVQLQMAKKGMCMHSLSVSACAHA